MKQGLQKRIAGHRILTGVVILLIILMIIAAAVILTLQVRPDLPGMSGTPLPYSTTFLVSLPEGKEVRIGNLDILALQTGEEMALKIGEKREEMEQGEVRQIADRNATITVLGQKLFETGYRLNVTWTGMAERRALFRVTLQTGKQVPDWLIQRIIPGDIRALPA